MNLARYKDEVRASHSSFRYGSRRPHRDRRDDTTPNCPQEKRSSRELYPVRFASKIQIQNNVHFQGHATSPNRLHNAGHAFDIVRKPGFGWIIAAKRSHPFVMREPDGGVFDFEPPRQRRFAGSDVAMKEKDGRGFLLHILRTSWQPTHTSPLTVA
jgi:hypothetical protein